MVAPDVRVRHDYEFDKGGRKWRLLERNRWATIIRTYPGFVLVAPALVGGDRRLGRGRSRQLGRMKALATLDLIRALPALAGERRQIQSGRRVGARAFAARLTADLSSPYFGPVGRQPLIRMALELYWRLVRALLPGCPAP